MCMFILNTGRTQCHFHTNQDHKTGTNDFAVNEDWEDESLFEEPAVVTNEDASSSDASSSSSDSPIIVDPVVPVVSDPVVSGSGNAASPIIIDAQPAAPPAAPSVPKDRVTGVPFKYDIKALRNPAYLRRDPKARIVGPNPNLTFSRVLEFFPVVNGVRIMHCGCVLSDALFDFFIWKTTTLHSVSFPDVSEPLRRPPGPRQRLVTCALADNYFIRRRDVYSVSRNGTAITGQIRLKKQIKALTVQLDFLVKEEEEEKQRRAKKAMTRFVDIEDFSSSGSEYVESD